MIFKKNSKTQNGFTLVELTLFMGLFSILLVVLMQIFTAIMEKQAEVESYSAVESDRLFFISRLNYDIQRATAITVPASPGSQGTTLTLTIAGQAHTYTLNNGNLTLTTPSGTNNLNNYGTRITALNFRRLGVTNGKNNIKITMTIQSRIIRPQGNESKSIDTTIGTR